VQIYPVFCFLHQHGPKYVPLCLIPDSRQSAYILPFWEETSEAQSYKTIQDYIPVCFTLENFMENEKSDSGLQFIRHTLNLIFS
jgi:hypothetical protein